MVKIGVHLRSYRKIKTGVPLFWNTLWFVSISDFWRENYLACLLSLRQSWWHCCHVRWRSPNHPWTTTLRPAHRWPNSDHQSASKPRRPSGWGKQPNLDVPRWKTIQSSRMLARHCAGCSSKFHCRWLFHRQGKLLTATQVELSTVAADFVALSPKIRQGKRQHIDKFYTMLFV